jgi:hypothetical protein
LHITYYFRTDFVLCSIFFRINLQVSHRRHVRNSSITCDVFLYNMWVYLWCTSKRNVLYISPRWLTDHTDCAV